MKPDLQGLKKRFREGRHQETIAECEAWCRKRPADVEVKRLCAMMHALTGNYGRSLALLREIREHAPGNADVLFNIGMCERELKDFQGAARSFQAYSEQFPDHADGWTSLAECKFHLGQSSEGIALADRAVALDAASVPAWTVRGNCQLAIGQFENAAASFTRAVELAPQLAELRVHRGDAFDRLGRLEQAATDYKAALALVPTDDAVLKKASVCLLHLDRGDEAIELCRDILKVDPDNLTAKLGAEWLLSQLVPFWHIPMMNEQDRNNAYYEGLRSVVTPDKTVFEIGTGSGLLAMMAARLGARKVVSCEAVRLVARTATRIVARNGLQDRITVLAKPSHAVQPGPDLPERADILVHEIFSSELLGEHVLPAIEDAKARLLKPGGEILPGAASIMIALVSGDELGRELHVEEAFGFDLRAFNAIHPKKRPLHREDLPRILLGDAVEAFRFDFQGQAVFPPEKKRIELGATQGGLCWGVIQWIRFEFGRGAFFENHPSRRGPANWQHTVYRFDEPLRLEPGAKVAIDAMHDRSRPWFELAR